MLFRSGFMFIVGVAMPYAVAKRVAAGMSWGRIGAHMLYRSVVLLLLGVMLHCGYRGEVVWELWNVLAQLSVTTLVAFLLMRCPLAVQFSASLLLIGLTELLYRAWSVPGFDQPFVKGENFGSWMDMLLMGKLNAGGWVAINCLPTSAHTIWGVMAGQWLMRDASWCKKLAWLAAAGIAGISAGMGLDLVTPIIKRICTSSFVIVSGGWVVLLLALSYFVVDVLRVRTVFFFALVVGMNPIFIYLFSETIGSRWLYPYVGIFTSGLLPSGAELVQAFVTFALMWLLCYWLYRRQIFIKI